MKSKEFILEAKKSKMRMPKQRDPNWQTMQAKATSGAGGEHKDRKRADRQGDVKHKKDLVPMESTINEDLGSFKAAGIPDDFSRGLLKSVNLSNDAEIEPIEGAPKAADFHAGIVINVLPDGDVIGMLKGDGRYGKTYQRMTMSGGKFQRSNVDNTKDAVKGMKKSGKFYKIDRNWFGGISRREKPSTDPADVKARTTSDALAGSNEEIYSYMNDTFMPKMKQQMEAMVDDIYANLRKLGNSRDNFRGSKTEQQQALDMAKAIESIANEGFSRSTMEMFLRSMDKEHHGFASIPNNERELRDILKNEPNARAKWAKTVLDAAKAQHDAVKNMIAAPVMKGLKGEGVAEGLPQTLRKVVPGYAKREIDKKMDAEKFGRRDVDKDANFYRYKKIQDKLTGQGVAEGDEPDEAYLDKVISDLHKDAYGMRPDREFGREWMSSSYEEKLRIYKNMLKSLHSDIDEGIGGTIAGGVGQFLGNKIDPLAGEIMRSHGEIAGRKAEYTIRKYMHLLQKALKQQLDSGEKEGVREGSDWGEPREILEDVLQTLEREVEWPLTEVMDSKQVRQLLAPIVRAVNDKLLSMDRDGNQ